MHHRFHAAGMELRRGIHMGQPPHHRGILNGGRDRRQHNTIIRQGDIPSAHFQQFLDQQLRHLQLDFGAG